MQHLVARQHLRHTGIGLTALANSRKKLAVLQLNAIHGYRHLGDIEFFFFAVEQIIVAGNISGVVTDVAKESTQGSVIVEAERQGANRPIGSLQLDAHVHGDAQAGVNRPLNRISLHHRTACLVGEQIHCVCGMVPQQMIGPTARLTQGVHIGTAEKIGLHVHLKHIEMACLDLLVNKLVTGIKATRVTAHGHQTVLLLQCHHLGAVFVNITQGNFHLHMFASLQASNGL